jgi:hypothetical protein
VLPDIRVCHCVLGLLALIPLGPGQPLAVQPNGEPACPATRVENVLSVVGPMRGQRPAWLVDDGSGRWGGAESPAKTLWVFADSARPIEITGRLRGSTKAARFQRAAGTVTEKLEIENPQRESIRPGGAPNDVLHAYAFISSHVFYAEPGCWEFTVVVGDVPHRIIRPVEERP